MRARGMDRLWALKVFVPKLHVAVNLTNSEDDLIRRVVDIAIRMDDVQDNEPARSAAAPRTALRAATLS